MTDTGQIPVSSGGTTYSVTGLTLSNYTNSKLSIVTASASGGGSLAFNSTSGVFTFTPANLSTDANGNVSANNFLGGFTNTIASSSAYNMIASATYWQKISGTTNQIINLPDATTLSRGTTYLFDNDSTGNVMIQSNTGSSVENVVPGATVLIYLEDNSTANGSWGAYAWLPGTVSWGTSSVDFGGSSFTAFATPTNLTLGRTNGTIVTPVISASTTTTGGLLNLTYTPASTSGAAIQVTGKDSQGGTGYFDFLKATSTTSGVTNGNKYFRLNSTGGLEIINSAYTTTILSLSDAGLLTLTGSLKFSDTSTQTTAYLGTATTAQIGGVKPDGSTITISGGIISAPYTYTLPASTTSALGGVIIPAVGTSGITNSSGTIGLATATNTQLGGVKVDNSTITITSGVISAPYTYTLPASTTSALGGVIIPAVATSGITNSSGTIGLATATNTQLGGVKVDNSTITISGGVISAATQLTASSDISIVGGVISCSATLNSVAARGGSTTNQVAFNGIMTVKDVRDTVYTGGSTTGTITPDCANGDIQTITLTGSITFNAFANPAAGQTLSMIITQPASGGPYTLTSTMKFAGGFKTLSTAAGAIDMLHVSYIGGTYYASLVTGYA